MTLCLARAVHIPAGAGASGQAVMGKGAALWG